MASRGKKKTQTKTDQPVVAVVKNSKNTPWALITACLAVLLLVFLFVNSFTVTTHIDLSDEEGNQLIDTSDESLFGFGKSAILILFAPNGYTSAVEYVITNLPALEGSELSQDIARQYLENYPESELKKLDTAFTVIFVTEFVYTAAVVLFVIFAIVAIAKKFAAAELISLVGATVITVFTLFRTAIAITMFSQSTKEFVLTAGGGIWLSIVSCIAAVVLLAVCFAKRKALDKENAK